jgi:hypothetical protein
MMASAGFWNRLGPGHAFQGIADDGSVSGFFLDSANVYHGFIRTP